MSSFSWVILVLGLVAAVIAVQFDEPWLEIAGAATFVLLFAWVVVTLRGRAGAARSDLLRSELPSRPKSPRDPQG